MFIVEIKYVYNYIFVYACATISFQISNPAKHSTPLKYQVGIVLAINYPCFTLDCVTNAVVLI